MVALFRYRPLSSIGRAHGLHPWGWRSESSRGHTRVTQLPVMGNCVIRFSFYPANLEHTTGEARMKLTEAVRGFLLSMSADGFSANTIEIYRHHLGQLSDHLSNPDINKVTPAGIVGFFAYLRTDDVRRRLNGRGITFK